MDAQREKQKAFLTMVFGGPNSYTGRDLRSAHAGLVEKGLDDSHFDAVAGHLQATLDELGVPVHLAGQVMDLAAGTRDDVLGRSALGEEAAAEAEQRPAQDQPAATGGQQDATAKGAVAKESSVAAQSIRVNVDLLENLMTTVSELVLTRNQLLQILRSLKDSDFSVPLQRLNHITSELQEGVMKTRMQPIGNAWAKLPRLVRDLSLEVGKKIELEMLGADTELDRQLLELIKDPLTHMVRNSADHGIETPARRKAAGKPEAGTITLNAYHEGGHIIIEIKDNGGGLPIEKIKGKILANDLATESELESMTDQQIHQFIFKPGLSTAERVTNVSGRGVGMDVVRSNVEKIGGTAEVRSVEGKGTTFVVKIPLTLAIVSALIVGCSGERFAIPQISVLELVRASAGAEQTIESINDTPVLRLRNRLLPLVSLHDLLKLGQESEPQPDERGDRFIVVTQAGTNTFGIIVDRVFDTEEIVVKPVAPTLRDISIFSGNTILGDGSVIMILDPNGIAAASGGAAVVDTTASATEVAEEAATDDRVALLLFRAGDTSPKAVPLALIARLEEIPREKVEYSQGQPMVQYRGYLMPLVTISDGYELGTSGRQPILVFSDQGRTMGLVVDEIVDIVEETLSVELTSTSSGLIGSSIIADKATDIIDTTYYLNRAFGNRFETKTGSLLDGESKARRILLVDDSPFFLNLLTPLLSVAGYDVTTAPTADAAIKMCEEGRDFDVIISDIEMPGMDGFEFAQALKQKDSRWNNTPLVALSSHSSQEDLDRGRAVGFTDYVPKFDRDALLHSLAETLAASGGAA
jgi:two-component system chemotaxis sensor kinase CheA